MWLLHTCTTLASPYSMPTEPTHGHSTSLHGPVEEPICLPNGASIATARSSSHWIGPPTPHTCPLKSRCASPMAPLLLSPGRRPTGSGLLYLAGTPVLPCEGGEGHEGCNTPMPPPCAYRAHPPPPRVYSTVVDASLLINLRCFDTL
jgi:hypothetical protein